MPLEEYLAFLEAHLREAHRVLRDDGSLYLHLDFHSAHHARLILDDVFGRGAVPERDRVGVRLRRPRARPVAAQARHDPVVREGRPVDVQPRRRRPAPVHGAGPGRAGEGGPGQAADRRVVDDDRADQLARTDGLPDAEARGAADADPAGVERSRATWCWTSSAAAGRRAPWRNDWGGGSCWWTRTRRRSRSPGGGWRRWRRPRRRNPRIVGRPRAGGVAVADRHIVALGGGGIADADGPLARYLFDLTGAARPRVCYVPTATGDAAANVALFYRTFPARRFEPSDLRLFDRTGRRPPGVAARRGRGLRGGRQHREPARDLARARRGRDPARGVGGGRGAVRRERRRPVLVRGRRHGLVRAGARAAPGRAGVPAGSFCPHYDGEALRRPTYQRLVAEGFPAGYAADDAAGLHFVGTELSEAISTRDGSGVYAGGARRRRLGGGDAGALPPSPVGAARPAARQEAPPSSVARSERRRCACSTSGAFPISSAAACACCSSAFACSRRAAPRCRSRTSGARRP